MDALTKTGPTRALNKTAPVAAKVVSLRVRPFQATHLCFEVGGILVESNVELGAPVIAFDLAGFYALLGSMPTVPDHPARLVYDFLEIQAAAKPFTLAALRAEPNKAVLSKAINARANAFYAKFANAPDIITQMRAFYSPSIIGSKPQRLAVLSSISQTQMEQLRDAYLADGRTDVVRHTKSVLDSNLNSTGSSITKTGTFAVGQEHLPPPPPDTPITITSSDNAIREDLQEGKSTGSATEHQTIRNTDHAYRAPFQENLAQYERAQISLIDEKFASFMAAQNLPFLEAVFFNELTAVDSDVYRMQIAYLNTILLSPIKGTVTGVYKNLGDAVKPGEPIIRVENNDVIYLMATLAYRGLISIGSSVTVTTTLFDAPGLPTSIDGSVVAVRGTEAEDDHWEVTVKCDNLDDAGKPIFPLDYHFDYDDTTVSIN